MVRNSGPYHGSGRLDERCGHDRQEIHPPRPHDGHGRHAPGDGRHGPGADGRLDGDAQHHRRAEGLDIYPWVFSAYLLAATVSTPIYGKLADIWGRKQVLLFGLGLFSIGSILSGQANSMGMLIAMRVVQGLGAGAIGPIVLTMIGDMFTLKERAVVQSLFSAVWGVASLAGPALGGVLTDQLSWRWVFYVTVPFGIVSAWVLVRHVDEKIERKRRRPDRLARRGPAGARLDVAPAGRPPGPRRLGPAWALPGDRGGHPRSRS